MCLTDGDEESLRLAESNVRENLSSMRGHDRRDYSAEGTDGHPTCSARRAGDACGVSGRVSGDPEVVRASYAGVDLSIAGEEPGGLNSDLPQTRRASGGGDHLLSIEHGIGCTRQKSTAAADGNNKEEADDNSSSSGLGAENSSQQQQYASRKVSVRKLRWGCSADIKACCCRGSSSGGDDDDRPWDVVLGSDIAALPYASAYGDLLQTIMSLVYYQDRSGSESGPSEDGAKGAQAAGLLEPVAGCRRGDRCSADRGGSGERRRVLVLLAHKRRHVSEDAFFDAVRQELVGGEGYCEVSSSCCRELGDDDVHPDFRGMGIRLHSFTVDVR